MNTQKVNVVGSFFRKIAIQIQRMGDHLWRKLFGLPQVRRSMITPQLYLGGQYGFRGIEQMKTNGITAIVSMRETSPEAEQLTEFKVLHLPTKDRSAPKLVDLQKGAEFISEEIKKGGKVYVHCRYGEGRGASMAIAYLIFSGMTYSDAYELVLNVRTFIKPTPAQVARLKEFESSM